MKTLCALTVAFVFSVAALGQAAGQGNSKTPSSGSPGPNQENKNSGDNKSKSKDEKKAKPAADIQNGAGAQSGTDAKTGTDAGTKPSASEVLCAAFYFQSKPPDNNPAPATVKEMKEYCSHKHDPPKVGFGGDFFLLVTRNQGKIKGEDGDIAIDDLRLFINETEIDDTSCNIVDGDDSSAVLGVRLERTQSSKAAWNRILANGGLGFRNVRVSIGATKKKPLLSHAKLGLKLLQIKWYLFWPFLLIFALLILISLKNDRFKNMLRDDGPVKGPANTKAAYSLSRVQMAYWFALSIAAYVLIWSIPGDRDTINSDILTLIGISAGTFLGAVSIDASKKSQANNALPAATAQLVQTQNVATAAAAAAVGPPPDPALATSAQLAQQAANLQHK